MVADVVVAEACVLEAHSGPSASSFATAVSKKKRSLVMEAKVEADDDASTHAGTSPSSHSQEDSMDVDDEETMDVQEPALSKRLDRAQVIETLSRVLSQLTALGERPHKLTVFHSSSAPPISIRDYVQRLATHMRCTEECLVLALVYIDRLVKRHPGFVVAPLNIHRLFATALTLAVKFQDDNYYSNSYYARCSGLRLQELNKLEAHFLRLAGWRLTVLPEEYERYLQHMLAVGEF